MSGNPNLTSPPVISIHREYPFPFGKAILAAAFLIGLVVVWTYGMAHGRNSTLRPAFSMRDGTVLIPESERPLDFCVIGVDPSRSLFCFLPFLQQEALMPPSRFQEIHRQLYWLNFEISHGRLLNALPRSTQIYVALPDPKSVKEADGTEEGLFRGLLEGPLWMDGSRHPGAHPFL